VTDSQLPPVALALLNWNGWRLTIDCLESVSALRYPAIGLFLCDNASTDDSVRRILEWAKARGWSTQTIDHHKDGTEAQAFQGEQARLVLVRSAINRGFAGGTNVAIRYALASSRPFRYVWALNTDTTLDPDALRVLVGVMEDTPRAGSAQSVLVSARDKEVLDSAGMRLLRRGGSIDMLQRSPRSELHQIAGGRDRLPVFGCCGAAALYRVSSLNSVGLFDEGLFSGFEDVDLACRLQQADLTAVLAVRSVVFHLGGPSRKRGKKGRLGWMGHRNKAWIVARWYPRALGFVILAVGLPRALLVALRFPEVAISEWWQLVRKVVIEFIGGSPGRTRRRVFQLGTKGFLS
jgi:GT2 family glycosyltransferase